MTIRTLELRRVAEGLVGAERAGEGQLGVHVLAVAAGERDGGGEGKGEGRLSIQS